MIVGNGDIATFIKNGGLDRDDLLFFASGVSNSGCIDESEYEREAHLICDQKANKHIVYFSSLSVYYSDSRYTKHKREMEEMVKAMFNKFTIVRIGNITWGSNPNTILNFFRRKIKNGEPFEVQEAKRFFVDEIEFSFWLRMIRPGQDVMNIPGVTVWVPDLVRQLKIEHKLKAEK
jgi:hypothetical protein